MDKKLHFDKAAEKEATDIGARFMHSSDVVGDMSRAYGTDLSSVRIHTDASAARGAAERGVDAFSTGKDVFFARGAFDRSDPASRGLLAHELSHSMQQGVGGGAPALTQSAPMGAAQGGLREWFNGLFSKSGNGEESAPAANEAAPEPEPAAPAQDPDAQPEVMQNKDPQTELSDMAEVLHHSSKWGLRNSDKFTRVSNAISDSLVKLRTPLGGDPAQDQAVLDDIVASFDELISACEDYLSRDPSTNRGKHRQEIVRQVLNIAVKDRVGFVMQPVNEGESFTSAMDILARSRQRTLKLENTKEKDLKHVGGAASSLAVITPGMLTDADVSGFFKEDATVTNVDPMIIKLRALDTLKEKMSLSDSQYEALKAAITDASWMDATRAVGYNEDRTIHEAATLVERFYSAHEASKVNIPNPLKTGESLNLSKRNVATSRLAELLGLGDLIAKSETATLVDADGTSRSGNLMQAARGQEVTGFLVDQFRDQYAKQRKNHSSSQDVELKGSQDDSSLDNKVTPEFLQSLTSLQVLDNLAAQGDRHAGNYFAEIKDGKLGKVQGIDNDLSFSNDELEWETKYNSLGTHGKHILDREGNLILPYMDRALADRITALDENVLRDVMADILEPWAIEALCSRFNKIKKAIQTDQEKNPGMERYLKNTSDWGDPMVLNKLKGDVQEIGAYKNTSNYVSNFLLAADLGDASSLLLRTSLENDLSDKLVSGVLEQAQEMGDPGKAKVFLKSYGVADETLSYLEVTGQLLDGPALLKHLPDKELKDPIFGTILDQWAREMTEKQKQS